MQGFTSISFKTEADSGFSSVNGVAKFSSAGIVLEFESKLLGMISKGVKEERLPIAELLDVRFRKGFLRRGARIEIRLRSFTRLTQLPSKDGKITLKISPEDWDRSREAVEQMTREMAAVTEALPPQHTPVSVLFDEGEDETRELSK